MWFCYSTPISLVSISLDPETFLDLVLSPCVTIEKKKKKGVKKKNKKGLLYLVDLSLVLSLMSLKSYFTLVYKGQLSWVQKTPN